MQVDAWLVGAQVGFDMFALIALLGACSSERKIREIIAGVQKNQFETVQQVEKFALHVATFVDLCQKRHINIMSGMTQIADYAYRTDQLLHTHLNGSQVELSPTEKQLYESITSEHEQTTAGSGTATAETATTGNAGQ